MDKKVTLKDIEEAYLYLKNGIYYENNALLHLKKQISNFEYENNFLESENRTNKFHEILMMINEKGHTTLKEKLYKQIKYKKIIKKLKENSLEDILLEEVKTEKIDEEKLKKIINRNKNGEKEEIEFNYIIDCPVEIHVISVLWILKTGYILDKKISKYSYGYRLNLDEEDRLKGRTIFKKYPIQYQKWKDNGLKIAREIIEVGEDAVLINLDLTKFYYHISHKILKEKLEKVSELDLDLTNIILEINKAYGKTVQKESGFKSDEIMPIGLYSSAILANFYLKELDDKILKECAPSYYGRYVDDFFIVFKEYARSETDKIEIRDKKEYFENKLKIFSKESLTILEKLGIKESVNPEDLLYNKKTRVIFLNDSKKEIELHKLENNFLERVSTFAYLPDESVIETLYKKISIEDEESAQIKKYDVSVYLSKIIEIYSKVDCKKNLKGMKRQAKILLDYFTGENIVRYNAYYEKVLIFLVMGSFTKELEKFYNNIKREIESNHGNKEDNKGIFQYLNDSLLFALALNPKLIKSISYKLKSNLIEKIESEKNMDKIILKELSKIINSNMFRQKYVNYPLLNFLNLKNKDTLLKNINFFQTRYFDIAANPDERENLKLCDEKIRLSPRFIHLDEFNIFYIKKHILSHNESINFDYYEKSKKKFLLNYVKNFEESSKIFERSIIKEKIGILDFYKIDTKEKISEIKVGISSLVIKESEIHPILDGNQDLSLEKKERIVNILNEAKKNKVKILIFPEVAIPFQWLGILNEFSRKNDMVITGGLEYIYCPELEYNADNSPKYAFNYLFTILPFATKNYGSSLINIRLKNHYAPGECEVIAGKRFTVPKIENKKYNIFSWKGVHFSNFNCFELADIQDRSKLKNYIDLLITSVFNKDTEYFRNVLKSTCRDLHVFIAQSNTAIYGDCEVIQPTSMEKSILGNIKGGINDNLLVANLEIEKLRKFQLLDRSAQASKDRPFKYTPPGINPNIVKMRINNELERHFKNYNNTQIKLDEKIRLDEKERIINILAEKTGDYEGVKKLLEDV